MKPDIIWVYFIICPDKKKKKLKIKNIKIKKMSEKSFCYSFEEIFL